jgi:abortive infection bacteriophage resistance protein
MRLLGGFFLPASKKKFEKPPLTLDAQVELLASRGMKIPDANRAKHYLRFIGYYRLSGYFKFFVRADDPKREAFRPETSFDDVLALYIFDRKMRALLMDAFERIISHEGAMAKGAFWLCDAANFDYGQHQALMVEMKEAIGDPSGKPQHIFISHFFQHYSDDMPPSWMIMETLSFGLVSRLYKCAKGEIQDLVSRPFGLHRSILESWLHALAFGRNVCAHNSRVWNRTFTITPKIPKKYSASWPASAQDRLYVLCCVIHYMMGVIADGTAWSERLRSLINERGDLPLDAMGFPTDWEAASFWGFKPAL